MGFVRAQAAREAAFVFLGKGQAMAAVPNAVPVIIGAKVDPALKHDLEDLARANERNVSQEIRLALRRHVSSGASVHQAALERGIASA